MTSPIRSAVPADLDRAAGVLAAAFADSPWTRWALPARGYLRRLREIQHLYLTHARDHGIVLVDDDIHAVAAFLPPDPPAPAEAEWRRIAELHGPRLAEVSRVPTPAPPSGAWTLETVGVDPEQQGQGLGTAILTAGLALIDDRGDSIALETSDERNVRLYERLGFATAATTAIADGPFVWSMSRRCPTTSAAQG
ncbi:acetyltransferase (GNAT) family protein [Brevibacterium sanguinis]|uniref:Acetyltransferase (GNAT) family protein n=2 Tax=Brevibacterium TaxID=1696 RepID=A0A366IMQ0_9MICO|nr:MULTISPECIES: GNAT family N-acetyltransferase [Brevibacterium]RBP66204.1 acetyltransferase (GNAT) family protein [Brevibacterium sanguinis]RBP72855.1 acetyltransferase (GNAT) family protein [Brevibacterium celere]